DKVFHEGIVSDGEKRNIIFHRHAEVLVPDELDLETLAHIICRTQAESRTLQQLLTPETCELFRPKIKVSQAPFYLRWTFVDSVELLQDKITIQFNKNSETPGAFHANMEIQSLAEKRCLRWSKEDFIADMRLILSVSKLGAPVPYRMQLTLDD